MAVAGTKPGSAESRTTALSFLIVPECSPERFAGWHRLNTLDGAGDWLVVTGEPLLNNPALVALLWSLKRAETRFAAIG